MHAPTGIGKTAAVLTPCIENALKNDRIVYFLTSRHTQHRLAIDTIKQIQDVNGVKIMAMDVIGKKWLCLQPGISQLYSGEFSEYCKGMKEERKCEFYVNTMTKPFTLSVRAKKMIEDLEEEGVWHCEKVMEKCKDEGLCPYEIIMSMAKKAKVIVADYYYVFNSAIHDNLFSKTQKSLEESIIIVDEGHNLPSRIRELLTERVSFLTLKRAKKEAEKFGFPEAKEIIVAIQNIFKEISSGMNLYDEKLIDRDVFKKKIESIQEGTDIQQIANQLEMYGDDVLTQKKQSSIISISNFLKAWTGENEGFARILTIKKYLNEIYPSLTYRNLHPGVVSGGIIKKAHSTILMSGTLYPVSMYKDILEFGEECMTGEYESPFPAKNRLNMIIPKTTTKFTMRNEEQFKKISEVLVEITDNVPGNSAIFFPSYSLRDQVYKYFQSESKRTSFLEMPGLEKSQKQEMLDKFKSYKDSGAVLLGVAAGSFGEGIDLPGDLLKCVTVVGLPLERPDLETKELIAYYDKKFSKGWDYGYTIPAFNKVLQNAGRCIRSHEDKGVIVFLDERYGWSNYYKHFPKEWNIKTTQLYTDRIRKFFDENGI